MAVCCQSSFTIPFISFRRKVQGKEFGVVRYAFRKLLQSVILIGAILLINFFILRLTPGNPYDTAQYNILSESNGKPLSTTQQAALSLLRNRLSIFFDPWPQAFAQWAGGVLHLDFGHSVATGQNFTPMLLDAALHSFWLLLFATLIGLILGVGLGLYAAYRPSGRVDNAIKIFALLFIALPGWYMIKAFNWFNIQLWNLTGRNFSIRPLGRNMDPATDKLWQSVILPIFFLGAILLALFWGQTRTQALLVLRQDYVRTARAKGLRGGRVLFWHVLRNSLTPIISIFGGLLPFVFASQILIEKFTGWQGLSEVFLSAASDRDYTVLMAVFTLLALFCVACNFLADLAYALVDPKIREKYRGGLVLQLPATKTTPKRRLRLVLASGVSLVLLVAVGVGFALVNFPSGEKPGQPQPGNAAQAGEPTYDDLKLPDDAIILKTDFSTDERKSFLEPRFTSKITYSPQPDQDLSRESKRTIFTTKTTGVDLAVKFQADLEAQGWTVSTKFKNTSNQLKVDYVFEKGNKYFWFAGASLNGVAFENRLEGSPLARILFTQVGKDDAVVAIVQGFKPA